MARQVYADNVDANGKVFETVGENIRKGARAGELLNFQEIIDKIDALDPEISALQADIRKNSDNIKKNTIDIASITNDNTLKLYKSRNLLDVSKNTNGLLSKGIVTDNPSYITTDFIDISNVNNILSYCNSDMIDMPFNICSFYNLNKEYIKELVDWESGYSSLSLTDISSDAVFIRLSFYIDYFNENHNYQMIENSTVKTHWQAYFNSYKSSEFQPMFDKLIDTFGDSITEQMMWQKYIADVLHTGTIFNHGVSGSSISGDNIHSMWQDSRINTLNSDIDCLIIMAGTNDSANKVTIGEMSRTNLDTNTFVGAYNVLLSKIFYKYYHIGNDFESVTQTNEINYIQIMLTTPIYCNNVEYGNMDDIAKAVVDIANMWGLPVVNQHSKSGINSVTSSIYLLDNIHPNENGGKRIANVFINSLKTSANIIK